MAEIMFDGGNITAICNVTTAKTLLVIKNILFVIKVSAASAYTPFYTTDFSTAYILQNVPKVTSMLDYRIGNAGLKFLRLFIFLL